ncbi:hypothetical protein PIB30_055334 [Stylosanthes scabra]|uniref:Uncharacterized protein n=1 Tax=Stylosanthes scabra TaxID=79078 RepID=A0ABU6UM30_9FABA|nr:hypothetical protein [Stylosanthes scabra]
MCTHSGPRRYPEGPSCAPTTSDSPQDSRQNQFSWNLNRFTESDLQIFCPRECLNRFSRLASRFATLRKAEFRKQDGGESTPRLTESILIANFENISSLSEDESILIHPESTRKRLIKQLQFLRRLESILAPCESILIVSFEIILSLSTNESIRT